MKKSKVLKSPVFVDQNDLKPPVQSCIKCGYGFFSGPRYKEPFYMDGVFVPERMEWTCERCTFITVGPTKANEGSWPPATNPA